MVRLGIASWIVHLISGLDQLGRKLMHHTKSIRTSMFLALFKSAVVTRRALRSASNVPLVYHRFFPLEHTDLINLLWNAPFQKRSKELIVLRYTVSTLFFRINDCCPLCILWTWLLTLELEFFFIMELLFLICLIP